MKQVYSICALIALLSGLPGKSAPADLPVLRRVILYNENQPVVTVAKDPEAFKAILEVLADLSSSTARAQMKALELEGRVLNVPNGTRAEVLKEIPLGVRDLNVLAIRLSSGPRAGGYFICFSTVAQPDVTQPDRTGPDVSTSVEDLPLIRQVILRHPSLPSLSASKDMDSLLTTLKFAQDLRTLGWHETVAGMEPRGVREKDLTVANGTQADVLKEIPMPSFGNSVVLFVRLRTGVHAGETVYVLSTLAKPDDGSKQGKTTKDKRR